MDSFIKSKLFKPTRYLAYSGETEDGTLILMNSLTGAIGAVPASQSREVREALKPSTRHKAPLNGLLKDLYEGGFLVPEDTDEEQQSHDAYLSKYNDKNLQLIIMPTEQCNFRCVYCYESFLRGQMDRRTIDGIKNHIKSQPQLRNLQISWFGGEPLLAADVVIELSEFFYNYSIENGIAYNAGITTNGSLLTPEIAEKILNNGMEYFQITIDGIKDEHNKRRILHGGGDTYDTILNNIRYLKSTDYPFLVALRHNYDKESLPNVEKFINTISEEFGGDPRFTIMFQPIGKWGGSNDENLNVCEGKSVWQSQLYVKKLAVKAGFRNTFQAESFGPGGYVCYAANPRSFVIGSDGLIYKCTVELDYHDRNIIGSIQSDGTMDLDWRKMGLWCETNGLQEGEKCTKCFFQPSCYGAICPKQWLDTNDVDCPPEKIVIKEMLPLIALESNLPEPPKRAVAECTRG